MNMDQWKTIRRTFIGTDHFLAANVLLILLFLPVGGCGQKEETNNPEELRLGFMPDFTHAQAFVGIEKKQYKLNLKKIDFKPALYLTGSSMMRAIAQNELDMAFVDPLSAIISHSRSDRNVIRVIGGVSSGGILFVAQRDVPPGHLNEFKQKTIAIPEINGTQHLAIKNYFSSEGMSRSMERGEIIFSPTNRDELLLAFSRHSLIGAWFPEPWASKLIVEGGGYTYINESSLWTKSIYASTIIVCRLDFLQTYPEAVERFLKGHIETTLWIRNHKDESIRILSEGIETLTGENISLTVANRAFQNIVATYDPVRHSIIKLASRSQRFGLISDMRIDDLFEFTPIDTILSYRYLPPIKMIIN